MPNGFYNDSVGNVVLGPLQGIWSASLNFIPTLIAALAILIIGLIVATGVGALIQKIF